MDTILFYVVAALLAGLGSVLVVNTSTYSRYGGTKYERRRKRREIGVFLWIIAVLILAVALFSQFVANNP